MSHFHLTTELAQQFENDGYFIVKKLFDQEEIAILREAIEHDQNLKQRLYDRHDASGKKNKNGDLESPWGQRLRPCRKK